MAQLALHATLRSKLVVSWAWSVALLARPRSGVVAFPRTTACRSRDLRYSHHAFWDGVRAPRRANHLYRVVCKSVQLRRAILSESAVTCALAWARQTGTRSPAGSGICDCWSDRLLLAALAMGSR